MDEVNEKRKLALQILLENTGKDYHAYQELLNLASAEEGADLRELAQCFSDIVGVLRNLMYYLQSNLNKLN